MNIIHKVTWKSMWKNRTRTLVTIFSVAMSAAMFMAVVTLVYSLSDYVMRMYTYRSGDYFVEFRYSSDEQYEELKANLDVEYVADFKVLGYYPFYYFVYGQKVNEPGGIMPLGAVDREFLEHMAFPLIEGRLPENSSEILLPMDYYDRYEMNQLPTPSVGDEVKISFVSYLSSEIAAEGYEEDGYAEEFGMEYSEFERTFTVVGIMEDRAYNTASGSYSSSELPLLTVSDGNEGQTFYHKLFVKTKSTEAAYRLAEENYGIESYLNKKLMDVYESTEISEADMTIAVVAVILLVIVLLATVSPIRNAFAISVSERMTQFGLLNSVGTTKKQLRRSVRFEALSVAVIATPLGMILGYGILKWMVWAYGNRVIGLYAELMRSTMRGYEGLPEFRTMLSWGVIGLTVLICFAMIFYSVAKPARRVSKMSPLEVIRQQKEIRVRSSKLRVGRLTQTLFGFSGVLAKKYYRTSRKKYRATVVSISISLLLFITVNYFADRMELILLYINNLDYAFSYTVNSREDISEELEYANSIPGAVRVGLIHSANRRSVEIPNLSFTDEYRGIRKMKEDGWSRHRVYIYFLEDEDFVACLTAEGIDPEPYLTAEKPLAVTINQHYGSYIATNEQGEQEYREYVGPMLREGGAVYLRTENYEIDAPPELREMYEEQWNSTYQILSVIMHETYTSKQGETILRISAVVTGEESTMIEATLSTFLVERQIDIEAKQLVHRYYEYSEETGKRGELVLTKNADTEYVCVGENLKQCPAGIGEDNKGEVLLLPYSRMPEAWVSLYRLKMEIMTDDYPASIAELLSREEREPGFDVVYTDMSYQTYMMNDILRSVINGLTLLISMVSAVNVFNTITANIALRRRDFGMLRSIGMTDRDMNRMMSFECLSYGMRSLFIGVPLGLFCCGIIYCFDYKLYGEGAGFPWQTVGIGSVLVFLIVFASAFYAVAKLRKDNPIDAIRMDNL